MFGTPGQRSVVATIYVGNDTLSDDASITVLGPASNPVTGSINNLLQISVRGNTSIGTGDSCSFIVSASDPDQGQKLSLFTKYHGQETVIPDSVYVYHPQSGFTGEDSIEFVVRDNGVSPLSASKLVKITVKDSKPSTPEHLRVSAGSIDSITLIWDPSTYADFYSVYKSSVKDSGYAILIDSLKTTRHKIVLSTSTEFFRVIAKNRFGASSPSNIVSSSDTTNLAPKWDKPDTVSLSLLVGASTSLTLTGRCFDPNNDSLTHSLLPGDPVGDTIIAGVYSFSAAASTSGELFVKIAATDPKGLSDTLTVKIVVTTGDNDPPKLKLLSPSKDSVVISSTSYSVKVICADVSRINTVECKVEGVAVAVIREQDSVYTAIVTGLSANRYASIVFTATDSSVKANKDSVLVHVKYDPTMADNVPPILRPNTPVATSLRIPDTTITVRIVCKDDNGISSVKCVKNSKVYAVTNTDSIYSATVNGFIARATDTVLFVATDNSTAHNVDTLRYTVTYDPTMNDHVGAQITLITPVTDSTRVSSSTVNLQLQCADPSGVASVVCTLGTQNFPVVSGVGSDFAVAITGLAVGVNRVKIVAKDFSYNANVSSKVIVLVYDPTMADNVPPIVALKNPAVNGGRVVTE